MKMTLPLPLALRPMVSGTKLLRGVWERSTGCSGTAGPRTVEKVRGLLLLALAANRGRGWGKTEIFRGTKPKREGRPRPPSC